MAAVQTESATAATSSIFKPDARSRQTEIVREQPWSFMSRTIHHRSADAQFWWNRTGRTFAKLLERAGYTPVEQYRELNFFALFVAPELGPAPDENGQPVRWRSCATADLTPMDFSWEWRPGNKGTVRYAFEPIGPLAGTPADPLNKYATDAWIAKLDEHQLVPNLNLEWYEHFKQHVLPHDEEKRTEIAEEFIEETTPNAGTFVAYDIEPAGPVVKVYLYPGVKAEQLGISNLELVDQAIRKLPESQFEALKVEPLLDFLKEGTDKYGLETGIVGIDCIAPESARIKIYVRAPHTSIEYLMDCLTLGGRLEMSESKEALEDLKDFWNMVLADAPDVLPKDAPGRASPGFYYTVSQNKEVSPKVYLSPIHFCKSDNDLLGRLRKYFSTRRSDSMMDSYEKAMQEIFDPKRLDDRCEIHYYIGCALHKNKLRVVTYISPQTFDYEQEAIRTRKALAAAQE